MIETWVASWEVLSDSEYGKGTQYPLRYDVLSMIIKDPKPMKYSLR